MDTYEPYAGQSWTKPVKEKQMRNLIKKWKGWGCQAYSVVLHVILIVKYKSRSLKHSKKKI